MTTACFFDPAYLAHEDPHRDHPESPVRLARIRDVLAARGAFETMVQLPPTPVTYAALTAVHDPAYVLTIQRMSERGTSINGETYVAHGSYGIALLAAGAVVNAVDAVMAGQVSNAFALVRPPGHHAHPAYGEGFCLFNNVAIAARHALDRHGLERVLIVDFDVHHGNGTQYIFWEEPRVLYFSTHQWGIYPGTGHWREIGAGPGLGFTVNVPLSASVGDEGYSRVFDELLRPLAERYRPQFILVSAGYDAHWRDPLAMMGLSVAGFGALSRRLVSLADALCGGRLVFTLEGGYNLDALAYSVLASVRALLGDDRPTEDPLGRPSPGEPPLDALLDHLKELHGLTT
jgi:acetoin utilization deacetylase AcuC-like enzyme